MTEILSASEDTPFFIDDTLTSDSGAPLDRPIFSECDQQSTVPTSIPTYGPAGSVYDALKCMPNDNPYQIHNRSSDSESIERYPRSWTGRAPFPDIYWQPNPTFPHLFCDPNVYLQPPSAQHQAPHQSPGIPPGPGPSTHRPHQHPMHPTLITGMSIDTGLNPKPSGDFAGEPGRGYRKGVQRGFR